MPVGDGIIVIVGHIGSRTVRRNGHASGVDSGTNRRYGNRISTPGSLTVSRVDEKVTGLSARHNEDIRGGLIERRRFTDQLSTGEILRDTKIIIALITRYRHVYLL